MLGKVKPSVLCPGFPLVPPLFVHCGPAPVGLEWRVSHIQQSEVSFHLPESVQGLRVKAVDTITLLQGNFLAGPSSGALLSVMVALLFSPTWLSKGLVSS
jgi:hypothetical protein